MNTSATFFRACCMLVFSATTLQAFAARATDFDCMIEPAKVVELRSPVVGILQEVHVRRGDKIRQGQLLVSIESSVERSEVDTARFRSDAQGALQLARSKLKSFAGSGLS